MTHEDLEDELDYQKFAMERVVEWGQNLDTFLKDVLITFDRLEQQVEELASRKRVEIDHFE